MDCEACLRAETNPRTGWMRADCLECAARSIANSPAFYQSTEADAITPTYRAALWAFFGNDWREGHARVKAWKARIEEIV